MNMKYIITESRLHNFMSEYLDSMLKDKIVSNSNPFIVISDNIQSEDDTWNDIMEFDHSDGRLWINNQFKKFMSDLFAMSVLDIIPFITKWFENRFNVEVEYTE